MFPIFGMSQEEYDKHQMQAKSDVNSIYEFFDGLTGEQLYTLKILVGGHTVSTDNAHVSLGLILAQLKYKHDQCSCTERYGFHTQVDHLSDEPVLIPPPVDAKIANTQSDAEGNKFVEDPETGVRWSPRTWALGDADLSQMIVDNIEEVLKRFNLSVNLSDPNDLEHGNYLCNGCQMAYPSITDRMHKAPNQCQYCMHNAAHGGTNPWS